ncbi:MAG TPA: hypothetical protein VNE63_14120 [Candidatus Acidoferrales bacterium]|nr:hypothetical protein [Candidatus Acidoferrales bacterium]
MFFEFDSKERQSIAEPARFYVFSLGRIVRTLMFGYEKRGFSVTHIAHWFAFPAVLLLDSTASIQVSLARGEIS